MWDVFEAMYHHGWAITGQCIPLTPFQTLYTFTRSVGGFKVEFEFVKKKGLNNVNFKKQLVRAETSELSKENRIDMGEPLTNVYECLNNLDY